MIGCFPQCLQKNLAIVHDVKSNTKQRRSTPLKVTDKDLTRIDPITDTQVQFFKDYKKYDALLLHGSAGTGKTFIALYKIPKDDYDYIHAKFFVPYPKNTPKKHLIDEYPLRMCFDCDNVIKGLCDALEESKVIKDDRLFSSMFIEKFSNSS